MHPLKGRSRRALALSVLLATVATAERLRAETAPPAASPTPRSEQSGRAGRPNPAGETAAEAPEHASAFERAASFDELSLVDLMGLDIKVTTATRSVALTVEDAPSTITVITRDDIERYGYRTVPEALATVPGLYTVDDLVTSNLSIRGIYGGSDSWSRTVKFMVDGVAVQYQSNGGALLGPEFVPMEAVQSIEIIRGPASALYGANAFLGVVNVITRAPEPGVRATLFTEGGVVGRHPMLGDGALVSYKGDQKRPFWALAAVQAERVDRSGLSPGESSPTGSLYVGRRSENDLSKPIAVLAKIGWAGREFGNARLETVYQQTDAHAAFSDAGVLDRDTRIARGNSVIRLDYELPLFETRLPSGVSQHALNLHTWGGRGVGGSLSRELLATEEGRIYRDRSASSAEVGTELNYSLDRHSALVGVDYQEVHDSGDALFDIDPRTGLRTKRNQPDALDIGNVGLFAQVMTYPWRPLAITGSVRRDGNSQWGNAVTYRAASVLEVMKELSIKGMVGTSFVPPAPSQLNAVPTVRDGGIQGNPDLTSQTARTYEGAVLARPVPELGLDLTAFVTDISNRVENVAVGQLLRAVNVTDSHSRGFELGGEWRRGVLTIEVDVAYQQTKLDDPLVTNFRWQLAYADGAVGGKRPPNYPEVLSHQKVALTLRELHMELAASGMYAGSRKATLANIALKGESYELAPYVVFGMHVRTLGIELLRDRVTEVSLHGQNLFGAGYEQAGAYGVDIPSLGRSVVLRLKQEL